jgi:hypothetical protein
MHRYKSPSGNSGVLRYDTGRDWIKVEFKDATYTYTYKSAGQSHINKMKKLAAAGEGLSTYIARHQPPYSAKVR